MAIASSEIEREQEEVRLTVSYDGPELQSGRMDARDLAPAMLATALLVEHSAQQIYGATAGLKIDIQADFRRGSLTYPIIVQGAVGFAATLLTNLSVSDVILSVQSLFDLIKFSRGRSPSEIIRADNGSTIVFHDGDSTTVNINTLNLYSSPTIRKDIEGVVAPLTKPGIDELRITSPTSSSLVEKDEV